MKTFPLTIFPNVHAKTKQPQPVTLLELEKLIRQTSATTKDKLPLLKLATFGNKRSKAGSLRHNDNVSAISGIEVDYDGGAITFEEAVAKIRAQNLTAILYTTPSHTKAKPRWRALLPTSKTLPPAQRAKLVARVNGIFAGKLATESFTLSLSVYFGRAKDKPASGVVEVINCQLLGNDCIDERDDLDGTAADADGQSPVPNGKPKGEPARIARALAAIPNDGLDWVRWNRIGLAAYAASEGGSFEAFDEWSQKSDKYDATATRERWEAFAKCPPDDIGMGTLVYEAYSSSPEWDATATRDDFVSYLPDHKYIYIPTGDLWPGKSVNSQLPKQKGSIPTSDWLDKNRAVQQMAWAPGEPKLIRRRLFGDGGWLEKPDASCFNLYRPPAIKLGDATKAERWTKHVKRVYPKDHEHIIDYLAHRVQHPSIKPNHALVLGGPMGSGKDTLLEPARHAVGPWNCESIKPKDLFSEFNSFVQTVLLHINEVRDSGEVTRNELYETMKIYEAAPPEVLRCNDKFVPAHYVLNVCGVIYTTNYPNALYLPPDDRRHYVAWSNATYESLGGKAYFDGLWGWYYAGGFGHVAAYLAQRDISQFNPKAPPRKTEAFWTAVNAHRPTEEGAIAETIKELGDPPALTLDCLREADAEVKAWINANIKGTAVPNLLRQYGYEVLLNANDKAKGLWMIAGARKRVYVRADLQGRDQSAAINKLKAAKSKR